MKTIYLAITGIVLLSVSSFCGGKSPESNSSQIVDKGFAVVELFTSEGCSSCPPADEAMSRLAKEFPERVYFLAYHVDYWDYIGWKDQFGNADYTERQNKYAGVFKLNSIYTPQVIINGEKEFVGSRESQIRAEIEKALKKEKSAGIDLSAHKVQDKIAVTYQLSEAGKNVVSIALVQLEATIDVKRGENKGHVLHHINIVRELKTESSDKPTPSTVDFIIPGGLATEDLKIIAFVQNRDNMMISDAAETSIK
jgi:hypothetical protein